MPKIERGRISELDGMQTHSYVELYAWAEQLEAQIAAPRNTDDPRWLKRWADKIRRLADKKQRALFHKLRQC